MRNVRMERTADTLTITVDLTEKGEMSKSGKIIVIASTEGNQSLKSDEADGGAIIKVGLNVFKLV